MEDTDMQPLTILTQLKIIFRYSILWEQRKDTLSYFAQEGQKSLLLRPEMNLELVIKD
jgi:hypothetical protein